MNKLARYLAAAAGIAALLVTLVAWTPAAASSAGPRSERGDILQFRTMFGNMAPFLGAAGAIRGVAAAPLPWMIRSVSGDLDQNGLLNIDVDHLVLANDPSVPPQLRGKNPVPFFAGIVSCLTASGGAVATANVLTANFPATVPGGNAHIHQKLTLPHPCVAPIVFVTSPAGGVWFAVTGR
jgi:hypothetical protein